MITIHHLGISQSDRVVWLMEELGLPYRIKWYRRKADRLAPAACDARESARVAAHTRTARAGVPVRRSIGTRDRGGVGRPPRREAVHPHGAAEPVCGLRRLPARLAARGGAGGAGKLVEARA